MSRSEFGRHLAVRVILAVALLAFARLPTVAQARAVATPTTISRDCTLAGTHLAHEQRPSLAGADLVGCDLRGSDLRFANLKGANMRRADLEGANLSGANLSHADLEGAKLENADLFAADLRAANLLDANLAGTQLASVRWGNTTCPDGSTSNTHGGTCLGHLTPAEATPAATPS